MEGELERPDPALLRVSDEERHRVAEILREAAGEGRIDLAELDERLDATYSARTYADLVPITSDLPAHRDQPLGVTRAAASSALGRTPQRHLAVLSSVERTGVWLVPERLSVLALMGGAHLDMREATFAAREVVVTVHALMGGAEIIVSPHVNVVIEGTGIMGGYSGPSRLVRAELDADSPTVRVRGVAFWGGVSVKRRQKPGTSRLWRLGRA